MPSQILDRVYSSYRIGDPDGRYPIFDAAGSTIAPGRWNDTATPILYTSENYSTAMLEKLVHGSGQMPPNQHFIEITIPNGVDYEMVTETSLPGWHDQSCAVSKAFGTAWCKAQRSLLLFVPSVVARMEYNILINPSHPDFNKITYSLHQPVFWDSRLFT